MDENETLSYICYYDKRNPEYCHEEYDDDNIEQKKDRCFCDNCFYGRHKLALEILRLQKELNTNKGANSDKRQ